MMLPLIKQEKYVVVLTTGEDHVRCTGVREKESLITSYMLLCCQTFLTEEYIWYMDSISRNSNRIISKLDEEEAQAE